MKKVVIFVLGVLIGSVGFALAQKMPEMRTKPDTSSTRGDPPVTLTRLTAQQQEVLQIKPDEALVTIESLDGSVRVLYNTRFKPEPTPPGEFKTDHPVNIHNLQSTITLVWSGSPGCVTKKYYGRWITVCD